MAGGPGQHLHAVTGPLDPRRADEHPTHRHVKTRERDIAFKRIDLSSKSISPPRHIDRAQWQRRPPADAGVQDLGPVEVVVNNAGWDDFMPFIATSEDFWDKILDINFKGALRVTQTVLPGMIERRFGRIVNIGSDAGRVGSSLEAVYSGAKGGIIAFTKTLAREVAANGITVNTVCPGPTDTPALRKFADGAGQDAEKVISGMVRAVPMKRLGTPDDVGPAVAFFASDAAGFITGQTLSVSGGLTMA